MPLPRASTDSFSQVDAAIQALLRDIAPRKQYARDLFDYGGLDVPPLMTEQLELSLDFPVTTSHPQDTPVTFSKPSILENGGLVATAKIFSAVSHMMAAGLIYSALSVHQPQNLCDLLPNPLHKNICELVPR